MGEATISSNPVNDNVQDNQSNAPVASDTEGEWSSYELTNTEKWWRDHSDLFERHGYRLRPRYRPGWIPSWKTSGNAPVGEDAVGQKIRAILDATRVKDGKVVVIKRVLAGSSEVAIGQMLSTPERLADPHNHAAPILDYFEDDGETQDAFVVMPLLRYFDDPPFTTVNETIDFVRQILEGINYLHDLNIAHRDCYVNNIMLDPTCLFPEGYHPGRPNRTPDLLKTVKPLRRSDTKEPVRYYFIDFGISSWFRDERSDDMVENKTDSQPRTSSQRLVTGRACQDGTVPELQKPEPYDPFPVDIYLLGRVIRNELVNKYWNLQFLATLANRMAQVKPDRRPTAKEALELFEKLVQEQSPVACRWRLKGRKEKRISATIMDVQAVMWEIKYQLRVLTSYATRPLQRRKTE